MSIEAITDVKNLDSTRITATERLVLYALAWHINTNGCAWPSVTLLASETSLHRRTVLKTLGRLKQKSLIIVEPGVGRSVTYALSLVAHDHHSGPEPPVIDAPDGGPRPPDGGPRPPRWWPTATEMVAHDHPNLHRTVSELSEKKTTASRRDALSEKNEEETKEEDEEKTEELPGPDAESPGPVVQFTEHRVNGRIPFKVYAAIASQAVTTSLRDDHSDDISNIAEHFKCLCAQQGKPYSASLAQRAVAAAMAARDHAKQQFFEQLRLCAGDPAMRQAAWTRFGADDAPKKHQIAVGAASWADPHTSARGLSKVSR